MNLSPSIHLSVKPIIYSKTQHSVRSPSEIVRDSARYFGENLLWLKMTKHGQNDATCGFGTFL